MDVVFGWMILLNQQQYESSPCFALETTQHGQAGLAFHVDVEGSRLKLTPGTMRGRGGCAELGTKAENP